MQLIYVGNKNFSEKGAVGTHTRGIINAFQNNDTISKIMVFGGGVGCVKGNKITLFNFNFNCKKNLILKLSEQIHYTFFVLKKIKKVSDPHLCGIVYIRYSIINSFLFISISSLQIFIASSIK